MATIIPQWAVDALGGPDATRAAGAEILRQLKAAGFSAVERARIGHMTLMAEAEARADAQVFGLARAILETQANKGA